MQKKKIQSLKDFQSLEINGLNSVLGGTTAKKIPTMGRTGISSDGRDDVDHPDAFLD